MPARRVFPYQYMDRLGDEMPRIVAMGTDLLDDYWGRRFHADRFPHLIHVHEGSGCLVLSRRRYRFAEGDTLYVPARTPHKDLHPPGKPHRATIISFDGAAADRMLRKVSNRDLLSLSRADKRDIGRHIRAMLKEFESPRAEFEWAVHSMFVELLVHIHRCIRQGRPATAVSPAHRTRMARIVSDVKAYVASHLSEAISLPELGRVAHVSPFYLSHIFTNETGVPLFRYITEERIKEAERLLTRKEMSVKQVAYRLGFRDVGYFTKLFRREAGVTPGVYSRRH